jgi:DNA-binding FrmR family transcriptional regulator/uncharacterized protein (DUF302 family)
MDYKVRTERPIAEVLTQLGNVLRERGWEVLQQTDLSARLPGAERPYYLLEAIYPPALARAVALNPCAGLLCVGRLILYEEDSQTTVALLDASLLTPFLTGTSLQQTVLQPCEELVKILREVGEAVGPTGEEAGFDETVARRLSRIEGQIRGLQKMLAENRECDAILTQLAAASGALKQVAASLISTHIVHCIREDLEHGGNGSAVNQKLLSILF